MCVLLLTHSLASFPQEAHKMVREANVKQATAEKQLKEAQGKVILSMSPIALHSFIIYLSVLVLHDFSSFSQIDVLQVEVSALKTLVLTSTPSSPNRQLHPQLQQTGSRGASSRPGGHSRNKSATLSLHQLQPEPVSSPPQTRLEDKEVYTHTHMQTQRIRDPSICLISWSQTTDWLDEPLLGWNESL